MARSAGRAALLERETWDAVGLADEPRRAPDVSRAARARRGLVQHGVHVEMIARRDPQILTKHPEVVDQEHVAVDGLGKGALEIMRPRVPWST
ncbi:hypothetical protein GCM10010488_03590 [Oerskovia jenensis]